MSTRHLEYFLNPKSVAVIGASEKPNTVGRVLIENLIKTKFSGSIFPVNPKYQSILSLKAFGKVSELPEVPDLAIVATPPATVPQIIEELGAKGTRAAVIITAGFMESGESGIELQKKVLEVARPRLLRIIGPNCLGIQIPKINLNASFSATMALAGNIAFASQSGAMATAIVDWAKSRNIGFSQVISLGDMSDVDFGDLLDNWAIDNSTKAVLLYMESVTHPQKFMAAARKISQAKPVIVIKAGRFKEGAKAALSHTGALAGSDEVYTAVFRRVGLLRVYELEELFDAAETLSKISIPEGERLSILTNGGGAGVLATDSLIQQGGHLASLSQHTLKRFNEFLPTSWSHGNPVDILGDAKADRYKSALETLLSDTNTDAVLALNCPTAIVDSKAVAESVVTVQGEKSKPVIAVWLGGENQESAKRVFNHAGWPCFSSPESGVRAFMHLVEYKKGREALQASLADDVGLDFKPDKEKVKNILASACSRESIWLTQWEAMQILSAYQINTVRTWRAKDPNEVGKIAFEAGVPVAVKISSPQIVHKSDVGGVALNLKAALEAKKAASTILELVRKKIPEATIEGFVVQEMVMRKGFELIIGMKQDRQFGPVILFGEGGVAVEAIGDTDLELPPLNLNLALNLIGRTHISKRLNGFRGMPSINMLALQSALVKFSFLVKDFPQIVEMDINPLLADDKGVVALDARIAVAKIK